MTWVEWLADNWFTGLQSLGIVTGFIFTCITLRRDARSRRVSNLFQLTGYHRELWQHVFTQPSLRRVSSHDVDLAQAPVTDDEALFVGFLILHLNSAHHAIRCGMLDMPEGLGADIRHFFSQPIPRAVWQKLRHLQDADFVAFVESHLREDVS